MSKFIDLKTDESISVNGPARITLMEKSGQRARLRVSAEQSVQIEHIKPSNIAALGIKRVAGARA